jgi:chromosomal replication initiation ATPase DnaA
MTLATTNKEAARQAGIIAEVKRIVAEHYGYEIAELESPDRGTARLSDARHVGMALARKHSGASYPDIALAFGKKDHESARRAGGVVERIVTINETAASDFAYISRKVKEAIDAKWAKR